MAKGDGKSKADSLLQKQAAEQAAKLVDIRSQIKGFDTRAWFVETLKYAASLLAQYHILSSRNLILSPPQNRIKLQMPVSFTVAVKLFAGSKLPRRRIALAAVLHSSCYFHQDFEELLIHLDAVA